MQQTEYERGNVASCAIHILISFENCTGALASTAKRGKVCLSGVSHFTQAELHSKVLKLRITA